MQINELLKYTLDSGASDLHLSVGSIPSIRLNGEIKNLKLPIMDAPKTKAWSLNLRMFLPLACAVVSLSRIALRTLPHGELMDRTTAKYSNPKTISTTIKYR